MKKYIKRLKAEIDHLNDEITERDRIFEDRTIGWQESEKGEKWSSLTVTMVEARDKIQELIEFIITDTE